MFSYIKLSRRSSCHRRRLLLDGVQVPAAFKTVTQLFRSAESSEPAPGGVHRAGMSTGPLPGRPEPRRELHEEGLERRHARDYQGKVKLDGTVGRLLATSPCTRGLVKYVRPEIEVDEGHSGIHH